MSRSKAIQPGDRAVQRTVELLSTIAHPLRLRLLLLLARGGPQSAGELQRGVGAEQSAVSHQLASLREQRLVAVEREGRRMIYRLLDAHVAHIIEDAVRHANEKRGRP